MSYNLQNKMFYIKNKFSCWDMTYCDICMYILCFRPCLTLCVLCIYVLYRSQKTFGSRVDQHSVDVVFALSCFTRTQKNQAHWVQAENTGPRETNMPCLWRRDDNLLFLCCVEKSLKWQPFIYWYLKYCRIIYFRGFKISWISYLWQIGGHLISWIFNKTYQMYRK